MTTEIATTEAVLKHHLDAVMKMATDGVDSVMQDYAEDAVMISPNGVVTGADSIRTFFEGLITQMPPDYVQSMKVDMQQVRGEIAYLLWSAPPYIEMGSDTFLIRDGKITVQTVAVYMAAAASGR